MLEGGGFRGRIWQLLDQDLLRRTLTVETLGDHLWTHKKNLPKVTV